MNASLKPRLRGFSAVAALAVACTLPEACARRSDEPVRSHTTPQLVLDMIEAHGGMEAWKAAPTVSFQDEFESPGQANSISNVTVDQRTRRVYMDFPGTDMSLAWDGTRAWGINWTVKLPPRFYALLNYYFIDLPWLTLDPGVNIAEDGFDHLPTDSTTRYPTVKMTFAPGTGDTPRDYFRLYIDPRSKLLRGCAYVVTYRAVLPPGKTSSPEHVLVYDGMQTVNGLVLPSHYTIYDGTRVLSTCSIRNCAFDHPFDESRMIMPGEAVVDTTTP